MAGGFMSFMVNSSRQNRNMLRTVQRRKNRARTNYASPEDEKKQRPKSKKKIRRISFLEESRSERQKRGVYVFILMLIMAVIIIGLSIFQ